ncbi:DUF4179 domain-containing protein [Brevibacillus brevis]|uniref:DUF4179 domain-containing protein n=1 Tax=Brevibacillus brevis TaxID=1393 RepID=A0ABY9T7S8_BREBE|nr:DUF4179 domain-containing protein [Brevibacillus brevis]WNC16160.1 DUF4179 domain-containing protein [Brevibacillus brevis]
MEKWPELHKEQDIENNIRRAIQQVEMPVDSFSDHIMRRIGEKRMKHNNSKLMKKAMVATSAAAVLGLAAIGSASVSPAMAESLKGIPLVSNLVAELTGKTYTYGDEEAWSMGEDSGLAYKVDGSDRSQVMVNANGQPQNIQMEVQWNDLKDAYKQQMEAALQKVFQGEPVQAKTVDITIQYGDFPEGSSIKSGAVYLSTRVKNTTVVLEDGKLHRVVKSLANGEVDPAALKTAETVFDGTALDGLKKGPLDHLSFIMENGKEMYELLFDNSQFKPVFVVVEKGTNRILKVAASDLEDQPNEMAKYAAVMEGYTEDQLLANAAIQAKQLLKLDLTGYKAAKDPKSFSVVRFTKEGAPAVLGKYNHKGQFYALQLEEYSIGI